MNPRTWGVRRKGTEGVGDVGGGFFGKNTKETKFRGGKEKKETGAPAPGEKTATRPRELFEFVVLTCMQWHHLFLEHKYEDTVVPGEHFLRPIPGGAHLGLQDSVFFWRNMEQKNGSTVGPGREHFLCGPWRALRPVPGGSLPRTGPEDLSSSSSWCFCNGSS